MTLRYPVLWMLLFMALILLEGFALGRPQAGDTLSETVWTYLRDDAVARFVVLPLWTWLTYHWWLQAPGAPRSLGWRDGAALAVGLLWAAGEVSGIIRR